ncbi:hypothetical protein AOL_s00079g64 [Orbilia oligospora ATCC 24927]|uniref:Zn(2)-C6 fungal-type domain-containing protein n=1 Tax=Arthrobotrys oligospora (strain ATCC 24927 / CBS 115.81 / DSM 1491) TaxID=756982 RepID=G1XCM9_ARTOA|nr:hypothetical protein AOL_s00079g64 [Orbilia oligospora ATCC 24927]EGX49110.1 hypothetical protein AOL_s00079g64 [Orbilia oligospora ATCC 24927]
MARDRIQLDFIITPNDESQPPYSWQKSPASSSTSAGPSRVVEVAESTSSDSPEPDVESTTPTTARKQSTGSEKSSGGGTSGSIRKGRGKQAFRHRKSHIKSKNGCFSCKERRVKCDEDKPECQNCLKRSLRCEYPPPPSAPEIVFAQPFVVSDGKGKNGGVIPVAIKKLEKSLKPIDLGYKFIPKALEFRMSKYNQIPVQVGMPDLRLMQNFTMNASQTLILGPNTTLWRRDAAELAFKHNFLMHALLMFSARHLAVLEPNEKEHRIHELQHRQHALGTLRLTLSDVGVTAANYDALIAANTLLAFHSCAAYDHHDIDAATDEYLPLMNGVKNIVKEMWGKKSDSIFGGLLSMPLTMDSRDVELDGLEIIEMLQEEEGAEVDRTNLISEPPTDCSDEDKDLIMEILRKKWQSESGPWQSGLDLVAADNIQNFDWECHGSIIYQKVLLSLLPLLEAVRTAPDSIHMDMTSNISCALVAWPAMQPDRYIELVQRKDPKALIILAHYYAAMCHLDLDQCWWLQGRPNAMCRAICREIGDAYSHLMRWPREACEFSKWEDKMDTEKVPLSSALEFTLNFEKP